MKTRAKLILSGTVLCLSLVVLESNGHALPPVGFLTASVGQAPAVGNQQSREQLLELSRNAQQQGNKQLADWYASRARQLQAVEKPTNGLLQPLNSAGDKLRRGVDRITQSRTNGEELSRQRAAQPGMLKNLFSRKTDANAVSTPNRALAEQYLKKGRESLSQGNLATAVGWYKQVVQTGVTFEGADYTPMQLANGLLAAGVNPTALQMQPIAPGAPANLSATIETQSSPLANPSNTAPGTNIVTNPYANSTPAITAKPAPIVVGGEQTAPPQDATALMKSQASQLIRQSQAAITRGDLVTAQQLAEQAHKLNVPNSAFGADEIRPWMVLLQINKARQSSTNAQQASGDAPSNRANQAIFDPAADRTAVRPAAVRPPVLGLAQQGSQTPVSSTPAPITSTELPAVTVPNGAVVTQPAGYDLFRQGEAALKARNFDKAREAFKEAWQYETEFDAETRQRLQDHLSLLRVPTGNTAREDLAGVETSDELRKLANEVSREQSAIMRQLRNDPRQAWDRIKALRDRVANADIDELGRQRLIARVERSMNDVDNFVERNKAKIERDERNAAMIAEIQRRRRMRVEVGEKLASLVEDFNDLMNQRRYPEAIVLAKQARELDPENPVVQNMLWKGRTAERLAVEMSLREQHEEGVVSSLQSVYDSARPFDDLNPIVFPGAKQWEKMSGDRRRRFGEAGRQYSEAELAIRRALKEQVEVRFTEKPLAEVMDQLGQIVGVNVHLDPAGLGAEGVTSDTPVTINLRQPISLKSALDLILGPLSLSHVIQDEVLKITSAQASEAKVEPDVYNVADLVIPIPNFIPSYNIGLPGAIREAHNAVGYGGTVGGFNSGPMTVMAGNEAMGTGQANSSVLAQMTSGGSMAGTRSAQPVGMGPGGLGGGALADFDTLIELITTTIAPTTWDLVGGPGSIAPFPTNLSLVVSQTQEVHDDIRDLLQQLRRLQDLQVTIEVRFITLNDQFFERIGVDFDFDIDNPIGNPPLTGADVEALSTGPRATIGIDPVTGLPTADLDIVFSQDSFGSTAPAFGGFDAATAANFGFAILSDIEAFFVIEAAQGDQRTNVLQAPKVTLFNGQQAFVSDSSQRPFVTSVIPVVGDFAAAHQPVIVVLTEGTSLSVQAVVSPDRRFVRLTLVPFFSQIGEVEEFTFDGRRTSNTGTTSVDPTDDSQVVQDNAENVTEGTTVQLPTFSFTTVTTTVSVPDGGTILLGGIKRLSEGRNERGVPMLSKLPYINRLFKNVGIGRTTQSLMMMVTPRIIIQEEEEEKLGIAAPAN